MEISFFLKCGITLVTGGIAFLAVYYDHFGEARSREQRRKVRFSRRTIAALSAVALQTLATWGTDYLAFSKDRKDEEAQLSRDARIHTSIDSSLHQLNIVAGNLSRIDQDMVSQRNLDSLKFGQSLNRLGLLSTDLRYIGDSLSRSSSMISSNVLALQFPITRCDVAFQLAYPIGILDPKLNDILKKHRSNTDFGDAPAPRSRRGYEFDNNAGIDSIIRTITRDSLDFSIHPNFSLEFTEREFDVIFDRNIIKYDFNTHTDRNTYSYRNDTLFILFRLNALANAKAAKIRPSVFALDHSFLRTVLSFSYFEEELPVTNTIYPSIMGDMVISFDGYGSYFVYPKHLRPSEVISYSTGCIVTSQLSDFTSKATYITPSSHYYSKDPSNLVPENFMLAIERYLQEKYPYRENKIK